MQTASSQHTVPVPDTPAIQGSLKPQLLRPGPQVFQRAGCNALGVDTLEDGVALRKANVTGLPIVILYWTDPWAAPLLIEHELEPTIWDLV